MDSLVLGASGNLGLALCRRLLAKGERMAGTYLGYRPAFPGVEFHRCDVSGPDAAGLVDRFAPRRVYHLAWSTNVDECESRPEFAYGPARTGLQSLIESCRKASSHLFFMSSDGIFGDPDGERYEDSPTCPINHYGRGKVEAEERLRESGIAWTVLRACPVGFNNHRERGLVNWAIRSLREGKSITGFTDASFTPLSVRTLAERIAALGSAQSGRILHFLSDPPVSKYDFLRRLARLSGAPDERVKKGTLAGATFIAPRPRRQDLQTRDPKERVFSIESETKLSLED